MYPDQDQKPEPVQYSVNYLDEIAPQNPKKSFHANFKLIFIILGVGLLLSIVFIVFGTLTAQPNTSEQLAARLTETEVITKDAQKKLKSSQLRSINSSLTLFLTNTNRDLAEQLKSSGIDARKLSKTITAAEKADAKALAAKLEEARLNATFDRTYAREMAYLLETTEAYIKSAHSKTRDNKYKEFLVNTYDNLAPMQDQLANFSDTVE